MKKKKKKKDRRIGRTYAKERKRSFRWPTMCTPLFVSFITRKLKSQLFDPFLC